jgi:hypothetical protein
MPAFSKLSTGKIELIDIRGKPPLERGAFLQPKV